MAFLPIVVLVGDRRETPPKSPADLLAASASMGDLYYLPRLQLPPEAEIRSDKSCVITTAESLRTLLQGKNLLVIGSPAANLMARAVTACSAALVLSFLGDAGNGRTKDIFTTEKPEEVTCEACRGLIAGRRKRKQKAR